ncbi:MAG: hypothetical protein A2Y86_07260 [Candidatus Aminicenantes bacterium RBG_13_62_12]|nr:MAG: hypothetical protein A2Y86_07260 [Candidatus Aminicenantes bacterium RBG_13_62_12]
MKFTAASYYHSGAGRRIRRLFPEIADDGISSGDIGLNGEAFGGEMKEPGEEKGFGQPGG